jgi:polyisoprenoid-binding protein YceI
MSTQTATPTVGTWTLDPSHSVIGAVARHLMVTKVRGRFTSFDGAIHVAERPEDSWAELRIDAASIETGNEQRDGHLRSPDFLDVERFPELSFRSGAVERTGADSLRVTGDLTIRDVTRPVVLEVTFDGVVSDPWGGQRAGFTLRGEIDREAYGMTWNMALESGGVLVSRKIQLEIEVEAALQADVPLPKSA